jgi:hypothetical protein
MRTLRLKLFNRFINTTIGCPTSRLTGWAAGLEAMLLFAWTVNLQAQPSLQNATPADRSLFNPAAAGLSFDVTSGAGVDVGAIKLVLNGQDQTPALTISGDANTRHAVFSQLQTNVAYVADITATDKTNGVLQTTIYFDTFSGNDRIIEAEDYNYGGGQFIDNPGNNGYSGLQGVEEVDLHVTTPDHNGYRPDRLYIEVQGNGDTHRDAQSPDWDFGYYSGEWVNYSRTFSPNTYYVYARMSTGDATPQRAFVDRILSNPAASNQVVAPLGFYIVRAGDWARYEFYALRDAGGDKVVVRFNGVGTFRLTGDPAGGEINNNFFMLVPAADSGTLRPYVSLSSVPTGPEAIPDTPVTATITDRDTQVQVGTIHVFLDNNDLTAGATITKTDGGANVTWPTHAPFAANSAHQAKLVYTDSSGTSVTEQWTFQVANITVLPTTLASPLGSGKDRGFRIRTVRSDGSADLFPLTIERAEAQLAGTLLDPATNQPLLNTALGLNGDGSYTETNTVNYGRSGPGGGAQGIFQDDAFFPNMEDGTADSAMEIISYVELPQAGSYKFGFRFAEGYRMTAGVDASTNNIVLGTFVTTLGSSESVFNFSISQPGLYPFRLVWFARSGGTDLEWYSFNGADRVLINSTNGLKAFQNVAPLLSLSVQRAGNDVTLSFHGDNGAKYQIQNSVDLITWNGQEDLTGAGATITRTNLNALQSSSRKFYRVKIGP